MLSISACKLLGSVVKRTMSSANNIRYIHNSFKSFSTRLFTFIHENISLMNKMKRSGDNGSPF